MSNHSKVGDDLDLSLTRTAHLEAVEAAAVFVNEAEELLHERQSVLADALRAGSDAGLSFRALSTVAGGMSREKVRRIVGNMAWQ